MSFSKARTFILQLNDADFPDDGKEHMICAVSRVDDSMNYIDYSHVIPKDTPNRTVCGILSPGL